MTSSFHLFRTIIWLKTYTSSSDYDEIIERNIFLTELRGNWESPGIQSQNKRELLRVLELIKLIIKIKLLLNHEDLQVYPDNTIVMAILSRNTKSNSLLQILFELLTIMENNKIKISASHIAGILIIQEDKLSRYIETWYFQLIPQIFNNLCK